MNNAAPSVVSRFLSYHSAPDFAEAFLDLHAPDAWMLLGNRMVQRKNIDPRDFTPVFQRVVEQLSLNSTGLPLRFVSAQEPEWYPTTPEESQGTVRCLVEDEKGYGRYWLHWGVVPYQDECRILWVGLEIDDLVRSFELGHASALAELAFLPSQSHLPHRSWLDVAYRRQFNIARPPLQILPDQKFSCHGTGSCCQIYWEVTAAPEAQIIVDALPWDRLGAPHLKGHRLEPKSEDAVFIKKGGERCAFLDENTRCRIHSAIGTPVFSACVAFPLRFAETGDGVAVSTSYHCGSVSHNLGLPLVQRKEDIWRRLNQVGLMTSPHKGYALTHDLCVDWARFSKVEAQLLDALSDDQLPMFQRMWVASRILEAEVYGALVRTSDYRVEKVPLMTPAEQALADIYVPFWLGCFSKLRPELGGIENLRPRAREPRDPSRVSRWLRNTLLSKDVTYQFDLTVSLTTLVLLYISLLSLESQTNSSLDESAWAILGTVSSHNKLGYLLNQVFEASGDLRGTISDPLAPVMFLAWLDKKTRESERSLAGDGIFNNPA